MKNFTSEKQKQDHIEDLENYIKRLQNQPVINYIQPNQFKRFDPRPFVTTYYPPKNKEEDNKEDLRRKLNKNTKYEKNNKKKPSYSSSQSSSSSESKHKPVSRSSSKSESSRDDDNRGRRRSRSISSKSRSESIERKKARSRSRSDTISYSRSRSRSKSSKNLVTKAISQSSEDGEIEVLEVYANKDTTYINNIPYNQHMDIEVIDRKDLNDSIFWDCDCDCSESCDENDCILCKNGSIKIKKIVYFIVFQSLLNTIYIKYK